MLRQARSEPYKASARLVPIAAGNPRRQAESELHKASRQACVHCRRQSSPTGENRTLRSKPPGLRPLPKAIPADRRKPNSTKQAARLASYRREAVVRQSRHPPTLPKNRTTAKPAKRKFCAPPPEGGHFSEGERKSKSERLNFFEFPPVPAPREVLRSPAVFCGHERSCFIRGRVEINHFFRHKKRRIQTGKQSDFIGFVGFVGNSARKIFRKSKRQNTGIDQNKNNQKDNKTKKGKRA